MARLLLLLLPWLVVFSLSVACTPAARTSAEPESAALSFAALDTLEREACPQLLARTFPLEDPASHRSTGRLWVRRCSAKRAGKALALDVEVLGWQWTGEASWGFEVREYVYFTSTIRCLLDAAIEATAEGAVSLRVWTNEPPDVHVQAIGRVDAHASTPGSSLLGAASALAGRGPNALATSALRSRVSDLIKDRAAAGIPIAIGEAAPVRGAKAKAAPLLVEKESLHPGGALISGSYAPGVAMTLQWKVSGDGAALARPVCVDEALDLVDAVVAQRKPEEAPAPRDVITMEGAGEATLAGLPCRWVLVTGTRDDRALDVDVHLAERPPGIAHHPTRLWVRATLEAYDLGAAEQGKSEVAVTFGIGAEGARASSFGRALVTSEARVVLQVAPLFEVPIASPIILEASEQRPRPPSLFNATPGFEETPLARGVIAPVLAGGVQHHPVVVDLVRDGQRVGWARVSLAFSEVE